MSASVNVTNDPVAATENGNIVALINHYMPFPSVKCFAQ